MTARYIMSMLVWGFAIMSKCKIINSNPTCEVQGPAFAKKIKKRNPQNRKEINRKQVQVNCMHHDYFSFTVKYQRVRKTCAGCYHEVSDVLHVIS